MHKKLMNKDFILMIQGSTLSALGDVLYSVAIGYWVYEKTNSTALMGIMSSISLFVVMFVMPFSGAIIDKSNRKLMIVGNDFIRGVIMLVVGYLAFTNNLSVPLILLTAFIASFCLVFFSPAVSTVLLDLIPHEEMVRGQSIFSGCNSFVALVGKAVSGALIAFLGVPLIILLNGISFILSAISEMFITIPPTKKQGEKISVKTLISDVVVGGKLILKDDYLSIFIPVGVVINLLGAGVSGLMLPFVLIKGLDITQYGYIMAAESLASLFITFIFGVFKFSKKQRYFLFSSGFILSGIFQIMMFFSNTFNMITLFTILGVSASVVGNTIFNTSLMLSLPDGERGAILGCMSAGLTGAIAISSIIFGVLCDIFPIVSVFVISQIITFVPICYMCFNKKIKTFILNN